MTPYFDKNYYNDFNNDIVTFKDSLAPTRKLTGATDTSCDKKRADQAIQDKKVGLNKRQKKLFDKCQNITQNKVNEGDRTGNSIILFKNNYNNFGSRNKESQKMKDLKKSCCQTITILHLTTKSLIKDKII